MECPVCHKSQDTNGEECQYCGVIFEKWIAKIIARNPSSFTDAVVAAPEEAPVPAPPTAPAQKMFDLPEPPARPILETSSAERMSYKVDGSTRVLFALVLFLVDPALQFLHRALSGRIQFSAYAVLSLVCLAVGTYAGMVASKRGYSGILTAGGAGFFAGLMRFAMYYAMVPGNLIAKLKVALPVFGIYCMFTFLGGLFSWVLRRFLDIRL